MNYPYQNGPYGVDSPAPNGEAITPSDGADLPTIPRSLWVGTSGNVAVKLHNSDDTITFVGVQGLLPVVPKRVLSTGTTASNIVGIW